MRSSRDKGCTERCDSALLISIAHLAGVFLGGKKLWLWRTVQRPTGNYFVGK